ncbi:MAG TPA: anti-sigma factor [Bryobacteraceae bacterium]|nr:anti-sigma factor [Bryobacteraceae bacterium]
MFAIGCLEQEEAVGVSAHLASDCETCWQETRRSAQFWALFGSSLSDDSVSLPSLSGALLPFRRSGPSPRLSWYRWGALAAALALITASAIFIYDRGRTHPPTSPAAAVQNTAELQTLRGQVTELTRQRDDLARAAAQTPPSKPPPVDRTVALRDALAQRETELAQLRRTLDSTNVELQNNRTTLGAVQAQLTDQQRIVQASLQQQNDAKAQASTALDAQHRAEDQVRTLSTQVQQLNRERAQLLETVQLQQRQRSQSLQTMALLSTPGTRFIPVTGSEAAPQSHGYALLTSDHRLFFYASNLPSLPTGREYQLWLLRTRTPAIVSGGIFRASANRTGEIEFTNAALATDIASIAVTDEPVGGSRLPTGHKLLIGVVRS